MSTKYTFFDKEGAYFTTTSVVKWIDVFTREEYRKIVTDSLDFCCKEKGLILYAYVVMSNHLHLIVQTQSNEYSLSDIFRDFKKFTAMKIIKSISENPQESRKEWILWMFERMGKKNGNNTRYQFWQQENHPILLTGNWIDQKLDYIHQNPVKAGIVENPENYTYSSARNYSGMNSPLKITSIYDGQVI